MLFDALCLVFLLGGILVGLIIGFLIAGSIIRQRMLDAEVYWKKKLVSANENWNVFYKTQTDKWFKETKDLVQKTYYETIEERDRAWEKKINGTKLKPKLPSN